MVRSMTAFARQQDETDVATLVWELKSVNHRYLEVAIRLPESLRELEGQVRLKIKSALSRGKVECVLRQQNMETFADMVLNQQAAGVVIGALETVNAMLINPQSLRASDVLRYPGVLQSAEIDLAPIKEHALMALEQALLQLVSGREREGVGLVKHMESRLEGIEHEVVRVKAMMPEVLSRQRKKLLARIADAKLELDETRLEQELVILAQKSDVTEELDRLDIHVVEVRRVLAKGGACGRRLDFLMQELNREANTLGSKSINSECTQAAIEIKVLIEQMREQVQNIE